MCEKISSFNTSDNVTIVYQYCNLDEKCKRPVLVLIHGLPFDKRYWNCLMAALCKCYTIVAMDIRGSGQSSRPLDPARYSLQRLTQDVVELFNHLGVRSANILGHSFGGLIAQNFAITNPNRVKKLILVGTSPKFINDPPGWVCGTPPALDPIIGAFAMITEETPISEQKALIIQLLNVFDPISCEGRDKYFRLLADTFVNNAIAFKFYLGAIVTTDLRPQIPLITAPTLIIRGTVDGAFPLCASLFLRQNILRSTLVEILGQGHDVAITAKCQFNSEVAYFLKDECNFCLKVAIENSKPKCRCLH